MQNSHATRFWLASVMGWPVHHSRSPKLHAYWMQQYGINGTYVPLAIPPERLKDALHALPALGFVGCNLTIPLKEVAMEIIEDLSNEARHIGAVNCVTVMSDGHLRGDNTDGFGFIENLKQGYPKWRPDKGPIVVLGAGGASRAILWILAQQGAKEIRLLNRTHARAQALVDEFGAPLVAIPWADRARALEGAALLVNTTSLGMEGHPELNLDLTRLPKNALVTDIVYTPLITPLLKAAHANGNPIVDGLGMLLHQARPAWQYWFGIDPEVTEALRAYVLT